jgi:hypothetical protein
MTHACELDFAGLDGTKENGGWVGCNLDVYEAGSSEFSGKWLLFPRCAVALDVWRMVVLETWAEELWAAKVASGHWGDEACHSICVYTPDYTDVADVCDIARRLWAFQLVDRSKPIYYKPDAFTERLMYGTRGPVDAPKGPTSIYSFRGDGVIRKSGGFDQLEDSSRAKVEHALKTLEARS